jgi:hypothetical protein
VEGVMVVLQIAVPSPQQRDVMKEEERHPQDETQRLIRDWGILIKYRNYLRCWRKLLLNMEKRLKRPKVRHQSSKRTE